jgi:glycerol kinase
MRDTILALDQGTTGSTALVVGRDGAIRGRAYAEIPQHYPHPGWVEHDAEEIWRISRQVMLDALAAAHVGAADVAAIGITNQRETAVVWDRRTGDPVHRAVVWQSRQSAEICQRLRQEGHEPLYRERAGLLLDAYFSGTKIRWILDNSPEGQKRAEDGGLAFGTIDTWLVHRMTGGRVHATDPTNASRTLLYDIHERRWHPELLSPLGVPAAMLPDVRPSSGVFGETAAESGLPPGIPIAGIAGDQQAALFGQLCFRPGMAKNTYGTGCFVMMNMGASKPAGDRGGMLLTLCCDATGGPAYALEGSVFIAGAAVQWLRDGLGLIAKAAETAAVAAGIPDTMGVYLVPAFAGLGAPYWDMDARGAIVGLTRGAGRAQIVRAALECIAYQSRDVIEAMNAASGIPIRELRVDGGASANDFLMQFQADILGVPVDRPAMVETTAAGAAFLAGLGVGLWPGADALAHVRERERLFTATLPSARRDGLYRGWQEAVRRTLSQGLTRSAASR